MDNTKYRTDLFARSLYRTQPGKLRYTPGMGPEKRAAWAKQVKDKVTELMAFPDYGYETPIVRLLLSKQRLGYRVEKYEISTEPNFFMTFLMLIPDGVDEAHPAPGVLCLPGFDRSKECLCGEEFWDLEYEPAQGTVSHNRYNFYNAQAQHFVRAGCVAVACDDIGLNEMRGELDLDSLAMMLAAKGRSYVGLSVYARWAVFRFMKTRPFVRRDRCAVSGHSLGTEAGMIIGLLDEDVRALVYNDFLCDNEDRAAKVKLEEGFVCPNVHFYPEMHKWVNFADVLAAFAPRRLFITEGGATSLLQTVAGAYRELSAEENFRYLYYPEYSDPACRHCDGKDTPADISMTEYLACVNVNPDKHFYKADAAVPWLCAILNE